MLEVAAAVELEVLVVDETVLEEVEVVMVAVVVVVLAEETEPSEAWLVVGAGGAALAPWATSSIGRGGSGLIFILKGVRISDAISPMPCLSR